MSVHAYYEEDDRQLMVGCCDGAHEVMYPLDDPEAVGKLLAALAEAGVLEVEPQGAFELFGASFGPAIRYVSPWKEAA